MKDVVLAIWDTHLWLWVESLSTQVKSENVLPWRTKDGMLWGKIMQKALKEEKSEVTEMQKKETEVTEMQRKDTKVFQQQNDQGAC